MVVAKPDVQEQILELQKWLKTQPHLPQEMDTLFLRRFVVLYGDDVERAKRLLELNIKYRNKYSHIFLERDPNDAASQKVLEVADFLPLPGKTPENYKLHIFRLRDHNPDKFNLTDAIKMFFMATDCHFLVNDEDVSGTVPIFDMFGYSLRHLAKTVISSLRIYMKFVQEAHPVGIRQIHILNCPSYLDKVLSVIKPFLKSEVMKLMHFHVPNADTPYKYFPRDMLPTEYGGSAGSLKDLRNSWNQKIQEKRDYLIDPKKWKVEKNKKHFKAEEISAKTPGITPSFKNLEID